MVSGNIVAQRSTPAAFLLLLRIISFILQFKRSMAYCGASLILISFAIVLPTAWLLSILDTIFDIFSAQTH